MALQRLVVPRRMRAVCSSRRCPRGAGLGRRRNGVVEEFADELAQGLVRRPVALVINVMLKIVEQLIRVRIAFVKVAGERAMQDFIKALVNARDRVRENWGSPGA